MIPRSVSPELARAICQRIGSQDPACAIIDPCAGNGDFVNAARQTWPQARIVAFDTRRECRETSLAAGATEAYVAEWFSAAGTSFNAPVLLLGQLSSEAVEAHVRAAADRLPRRSQIVFLLPLEMLISEKFAQLWEDFPLAALAPIIPRPLDDTGKRVSLAVFVWRVGYYEPGVLWPVIRWTDPSRSGRGKNRRSLASVLLGTRRDDES